MSKCHLKLYFCLLLETSNDPSVYNLVHIQCIRIHFDWRPFIFPCVKQLIIHFYFTESTIYLARSKRLLLFLIKIINNLIQVEALDLVNTRLSFLIDRGGKPYLVRNFCFTFFNPYPRELSAEMHCSQCLQNSVWIKKHNKYLRNDILRWYFN